MVDPDRVRAMLDELREWRERLTWLHDLPVNQYLAERAVDGRYSVQAAAQTCIDLASHLIASDGLRAPKDYRDTFTVLEENGILDTGAASRLRELAGLRNLLVHVYGKVDDRIVFGALAETLEITDAFARAIAGRIDS